MSVWEKAVLAEPAHSTTAERFPAERPAGCPFDPAPEYAGYSERGELPKLACPAGIDAYVVTGYTTARQVLGDGSTSSRAASSFHMLPGVDLHNLAAPGAIVEADGDEHTRLRRLTTPEFTVAGARALTPYLHRIIAEHIDAMLAKDGPVDLVAEFALPIPSLVICEMLQVPYAEREEFQRRAEAALDYGLTAAETAAHVTALHDYMRDLTRTRLDEPSPEDMLGRIILRSREMGAPITEDELATLGMVLLVAGHETTANQLALSVLALLRNPPQWAALCAEPSLVDNAVEELLRYLTVLQFGSLRYTTEPMDIEGHPVDAGEWVVTALSAANRDKTVFPDPDTIDLSRPGTTNHLAFGFGRHACLGQQLARTELRAMLRALLERTPGLRLAVPFEDLEFKTSSIVYGLRSLPVILRP